MVEFTGANEDITVYDPLMGGDHWWFKNDDNDKVAIVTFATGPYGDDTKYIRTTVLDVNEDGSTSVRAFDEENVGRYHYGLSTNDYRFLGYTNGYSYYFFRSSSSSDRYPWVDDTTPYYLIRRPFDFSTGASGPPDILWSEVDYLGFGAGYHPSWRTARRGDDLFVFFAYWFNRAEDEGATSEAAIMKILPSGDVAYVSKIISNTEHKSWNDNYLEIYTSIGPTFPDPEIDPSNIFVCGGSTYGVDTRLLLLQDEGDHASIVGTWIDDEPSETPSTGAGWTKQGCFVWMDTRYWWYDWEEGTRFLGFAATPHEFTLTGEYVYPNNWEEGPFLIEGTETTFEEGPDLDYLGVEGQVTAHVYMDDYSLDRSDQARTRFVWFPINYEGVGAPEIPEFHSLIRPEGFPDVWSGYYQSPRAVFRNYSLMASWQLTYWVGDTTYRNLLVVWTLPYVVPELEGPIFVPDLSGRRRSVRARMLMRP